MAQSVRALATKADDASIILEVYMDHNRDSISPCFG